jgi:hypothetical protein
MKAQNQKNLVLPIAALVICLGSSLAVNIKFNHSTGDIHLISGISLRLPASQGSQSLRSGSHKAERKLASELAGLRTNAANLSGEANRGLASLGRPSDLFEDLKFGVLEGKYALKMDGDKISEMKFIDIPDSTGRPAQIRNRIEFLKRYGALLDSDSQPQQESVFTSGSMTTETYRLKSNSHGADIIVSFILDDLDRVFEMRTDKASAPKIF